MTRAVRAYGAVLVGLLASAAVSSADPQQDEAAIRGVQVRQAEAWNRHDAAAYARLFTDDGDVVNVVGWWWKGRAEIETKLKQAFSYVFAESTLTVTDVAVKFLSPDIAVAHVSWSMKGAKTPPNMPEPRQGIQTQVLQKHQWDTRTAVPHGTASGREAVAQGGLEQRGRIEQRARKASGSASAVPTASSFDVCMGRTGNSHRLRIGRPFRRQHRLPGSSRSAPCRS
jgi:uncharacterized protein (TIGR02246 family)